MEVLVCPPMTSSTNLIARARLPEPNLFKKNVQGRKNPTPEQRERTLDEYERSNGHRSVASCAGYPQGKATSKPSGVV